PRVVGAGVGGGITMPLNAYLVVSALLFTIGALGVLVRRNPLIMFMSIELMLNAVNLSFMAFAHFLNSVDGWMFVFLVLVVAAAEVVVGLAIIVSIFRARRDIEVDDLTVLKGWHADLPAAAPLPAAGRIRRPRSAGARAATCGDCGHRLWNRAGCVRAGRARFHRACQRHAARGRRVF